MGPFSGSHKKKMKDGGGTFRLARFCYSKNSPDKHGIGFLTL